MIRTQSGLGEGTQQDRVFLVFFCFQAKLEAFLNLSLVTSMKHSVRSSRGKIYEYGSKTCKRDSKVIRKEKKV